MNAELAQELGKKDSEILLRDRKLVLLVDLDQTLIHTTNDHVPPNLKVCNTCDLRISLVSFCYDHFYFRMFIIFNYVAGVREEAVVGITLAYVQELLNF